MGNSVGKPILKIWRFVDGKPGHERQSEGLIHSLSALCQTEVACFDVTGGRLRSLRRLIDFYRNQKRGEKPDLLMGAGHRTHLSLVFGRWLTGARSVVLMKPSLPRGWFDYRIIPEHDGPRGSERELVVQGVLNTVTRGKSHAADKGVILIGGPCRHVDWIDESVLKQVRHVVGKDSTIQWSLTTSRRTPSPLCEAFDQLQAENFRYVSHTKTGPNWVAEHLAQSGQAWVSPDSVSMVYEALTSGSHVGVFDMHLKGGGKLKLSVDRLVEDHMVTPFVSFEGLTALPAPPRHLNEAERSARWLFERTLESGGIS